MRSPHKAVVVIVGAMLVFYCAIAWVVSPPSDRPLVCGSLIAWVLAGAVYGRIEARRARTMGESVDAIRGRMTIGRTIALLAGIGCGLYLYLAYDIHTRGIFVMLPYVGWAIGYALPQHMYQERKV